MGFSVESRVYYPQIRVEFILFEGGKNIINENSQNGLCYTKIDDLTLYQRTTFFSL